MISKQQLIYSRIQEAFHPTHLEVIDESAEHVGHAGYQGGGKHFAVIISAECFTHVTRITAHRQIYALFLDMMPHEIHALRIKII